MDAYAIFGGGGMKGIALGGCLYAAKRLGANFWGYGGTSAGALVALVGALGYREQDLKRIFVDELDSRSLFDDEGAELNRLRFAANKCQGKFTTAMHVLFNLDLVSRLSNNLGLYRGDHISELARQLIVRQIPALENEADITFNQLEEHGCQPLKMVSTNISTRAPQVHSAAGGNELNGSVLQALRASMCYPFAFQPVRVDAHLWLDGGLSSNLPVFLFRKERDQTGRRVMAFDLISERAAESTEYGFKAFCANMLETALQSGDTLLRQSSRDVFYVPVTMPPSASTLAIDLSKQERVALFERGELTTHRFWREGIPQLKDAVDETQMLQAAYEVIPRQVETVLGAIAAEFERETRASLVRANVMLPSGPGMRRVVYQFGMDADSDLDLELAEDAGCSGAAWTAREPYALDLGDANEMIREWKLTREQQNRVRRDRRGVLSVPLFQSGVATREAKSADDLTIIGVLSVDTATPLLHTGWLTDRRHIAEKLAKEWGGVVSRLLS
jgi:NTE family protein